MKDKIINWFLDQVGVIDAFERIIAVEQRINEIEKKQAKRYPHLIERIAELEKTVEELDITINALQMEADILLAKTQK